MLSELRIRNVAIIDAVSLPLVPGFNVLSGETGAGKSIIVGALGLLLGERGSSDIIRTGAERASVEGVFDSSDLPELHTMLDDRGIEVERGVVVLRRELVAGGKGRAWVNGTPVSATVLADVGRGLVNLHGQHESQTLLHADGVDRLQPVGRRSDRRAQPRLHPRHADLGAFPGHPAARARSVRHGGD